jgi:hypothetical protein
MAVGDIINGLIVGTGAWFSFQPAATNEIILTSIFTGTGTTQYIALGNGVNSGTIRNGYNTAYNISTNTKIGITNTNYIEVYTGETASGYTGIQIK